MQVNRLHQLRNPVPSAYHRDCVLLTRRQDESVNPFSVINDILTARNPLARRIGGGGEHCISAISFNWPLIQETKQFYCWHCYLAYCFLSFMNDECRVVSS